MNAGVARSVERTRDHIIRPQRVKEGDARYSVGVCRCERSHASAASVVLNTESWL